MASITSWSMRSILRSRGAIPFILQPKQNLLNTARLCQAPVVENQAESRTSDDSEAELSLSDNCVKQLKKTLSAEDKSSFLRVSVEGGGCSGFQYKFSIDSEVQDDDRIFEKEGSRVVVDELSLEYLKGSTVDYHQELIRSAFRVVLNPKAEKGCSCGTSFSLKL